MAENDDILMENYVLGGIWVGVARYVCEEYCRSAELFTAIQNFGFGETVETLDPSWRTVDYNVECMKVLLLLFYANGRMA